MYATRSSQKKAKENSSFFNIFNPNKKVSKSQEEAEALALIEPLYSVYSEVIKEFKTCLKIIQSKKSKDAKEESILKLNNLINTAYVKFKIAEKKCKENIASYMIQERKFMIQKLSEDIPKYPEILEESYDMFEAVLQGKYEETISNPQKTEQEPVQTQTQNQTFSSNNDKLLVQNQLILIKETYDRVIQGINDYLKALSQGKRNLNQEKNNLLGFIQTAFVQFRSIQQSFPKEFYEMFITTFQRMKNDFEKFKNMIPGKFRVELNQVFTDFDQLLNSILPYETKKEIKQEISHEINQVEQQKQEAEVDQNIKKDKEEQNVQALCNNLYFTCQAIEKSFRSFKPGYNRLDHDLYHFKKLVEESQQKLASLRPNFPKKYYTNVREQIREQQKSWYFFRDDVYKCGYWDHLKSYYDSFAQSLNSLFYNYESK